MGATIWKRRPAYMGSFLSSSSSSSVPASAALTDSTPVTAGTAAMRELAKESPSSVATMEASKSAADDWPTAERDATTLKVTVQV